ncbi:MAG: biopolymer transporter Tol [Planctomycetota bacterium]|nr:biopolymer transporter Tol [Planctomycetota bacterium]
MRNKWNRLGSVLGVWLCVAVAFAGAQQQEEKTDSVESNFLSNIRQVTSGFVKAGEGYFSPDGTQIVYQAITTEYPFYQIYTQPLAGGRPRMLSTGRGRTTCSYFSIDGQQILFSSSHTDPNMTETEQAEIKQQEEDRKNGVRRRYSWPFDPHTEMYVVDLQGNILKQLTNADGYDAEGAFSSDGKHIAFCSTRDGDPDIYVMKSNGRRVRQLTNAKGYDGGPFISPCGNWVIFRSDRKEEHMLQIYVIGIDGKHEKALTDTTGVNWGPYWHPTKPYLIWSGADHSTGGRPNYDLWLAKYEISPTGEFVMAPAQRVTDHVAADVLPVFSPDGNQLMWTSTRTDEHTSQLFIADFMFPEK